MNDSIWSGMWKARVCRRALFAAAMSLALPLVGAVSAQQTAAPPAAAPAPVPAAVAMPRPSPQEIDLARRGFEQFLATTDAGTRDIIKKYPGLLEVRPPQPNSAIVPNLAPMFQAKHQANREVAAKGDAELLFMGDSITDFWRNDSGAFAGKAIQDQYFGKWRIANFGIAGDTTQGVLYRLQHGEGEGIKPRAVMLMIGTNNTARNTAGEIAEGIGAVVLELRQRFPQAKILLLAVFPRGPAADPVRNTIAEINKTIAKLHDGNHVQYLDIGKVFLDAQGNIPADVMSDALHPSAKGYELWAKAVIAPITAMMQ